MGVLLLASVFTFCFVLFFTEVGDEVISYDLIVLVVLGLRCENSLYIFIVENGRVLGIATMVKGRKAH